MRENVLENIRLYQDIRLRNTSPTEERKRQETFWLTWSLGITANQLLMNHPVVKGKFRDAISTSGTETMSVFKTAFEIENLMKMLTDPSNLKSES